MGCCGSKRASQVTTSYASTNDVIDKKVSEVTILSSHNSYLDSVQHLSISSTDAIEKVLDLGARCIELDVFHNRDDKPIVGHGTNLASMDVLGTTTIMFEDAIKVIAEKAFKNTSLPLFICIENNARESIRANNEIARILRLYLGDYLIQNQNIAQMSIRQLSNKVVIMSGSGNVGDMLKLVNVMWGRDGAINIASGSYVPSKTDAITRIYPSPTLAHFFSLNYDPLPYLSTANFVALNLQTNDPYRKKALKFFDGKSLVPIV